MPVHGSDKPGIVSSLAFDFIYRDKMLPFWEDASFVAEECKPSLKPGEFGLGLDDGQAKSVIGNRTVRYRPEFIKVLRHNAAFVTESQKLPDGITGQHVLRVVPLSGSSQHIRIEERSHSPRPS